MAHPHTIGRQVVDATVFGDERVAPEIMRRISLLCSETLANRLAEVLQPFDNTERWILIDELVIDAGVVALNDFEAQLIRAVQEAFAKLASDIREAGAISGVTDLGPDIALRGAHEIDGPAADLSAFVHFLRHGRLPWWYSLEAGTTLRSVVSKAVVSGTVEQHLMRGVFEAVDSSSVARQRLARQFEASVAIAVISRLNRTLADALEVALFVTEQLRAALDKGRALEQELIHTAVDALVDSASLHAGLPDDLAGSIILLSSERIQGRLGPGDENALSRFLEMERITRSDEIDLAAANRQRAVDPPAEMVRDDVDVITADGLFVNNAGVILLHPFLSGLFGELGLFADGKLTSVSRCALLIHHLATGARTAEEHELTFAKVLCGVPIDSLLEYEPPVSDAEADECETLLRAVIQHWEALRNTQPDGLRGNFLTRPGRLSLDGDTWTLIVERRSHDLLLDHLPWGIGLVKLGWMKNLMRVEWPS